MGEPWKHYIKWNLYEMSRGGKSIETENILVVAKFGSRVNKEWLLDKYRVFLLGW